MRASLSSCRLLNGNPGVSPAFPPSTPAACVAAVSHLSTNRTGPPTQTLISGSSPFPIVLGAMARRLAAVALALQALLLGTCLAQSRAFGGDARVASGPCTPQQVRPRPLLGMPSASNPLLCSALAPRPAALLAMVIGLIAARQQGWCSAEWGRRRRRQGCRHTPPARRSQAPTLPLQIHVSLTGNPTELRVSWKTAAGSCPSGVISGPAAALSSTPIDPTHLTAHTGSQHTYTADDMCSAPARTLHFGTAYLHTAVLTGLEPGERHFYQVGTNGLGGSGGGVRNVGARVWRAQRRLCVAAACPSAAGSRSRHAARSSIPTPRRRRPHPAAAASLSCLLCCRRPQIEGGIPIEFVAPVPAGPTHSFRFLVFGDMGDSDHKEAKSPGWVAASQCVF